MLNTRGMTSLSRKFTCAPIERIEKSDHPGKLGWLDRVVSAEPVLTPQLATLCRAVADRYAGTMGDVVRLAIPPRHARTEKETTPDPVAVVASPELADWHRYALADSYVENLADGHPRAVWQALPGEDWPRRLAELAAATLTAGRGCILVVPDQRDLDRVWAECEPLIGDRGVALSAGLGPTARYRRWLAVRRGAAQRVRRRTLHRP